MHTNNTCLKERSAALNITINGLMIALVFLFTMFINLRLPVSINGGLIHLGNVPLFVAALVFGPRTGAIAGGIGMAIFDVSSGWALWAPFTLVIRSVMGYMIGYIADKNPESFWMRVLAIFCAALWMLLGYYVTEVILYGNWLSPLTSIPGNVLQILVASVITLPFISRLKKICGK